jgi:hypothetical protein
VIARAALATLVLACALAPVLAGCQTLDDGRSAILKPSALDGTFRDLDAANKNPFGKATTRVDYIISGVRPYDAFFKEAAEVKGVVVLAEVVLKETDVFVASVKKSGGRRALDEAGQREFDRHQARLTRITTLLTDVPARSAALTETGQKLAADAPQTFVGPQAFKLPGVIKGLQGASDDLKDGAARVPGLGRKLAASGAALAGL